MEDPLIRCNLCPHRCGVNRRGGQLGFCRAGTGVDVFRYGPHHGEEPPVSGTRGSGTVFFSRCTMSCIYCQNYPWSQQGQGTAYDTEGLAGILCGLRDQGVHNWNFVSPTPWLPVIREAHALACARGPALPVVYNTSGYERVETVRDYGDLINVWLTDLRYSTPETATEAARAPQYVEAARSALSEMWRLRGPIRLDDDGIATGGTICRILILPGRHGEAIDNLRWLAANVGNSISLSLMSQYLPLYKAPRLDGWNRRITREEYDQVCDEAAWLGFDEGWIQEFDAAAPQELVGCEMKAVTAAETTKNE